ncbi:right-handed parallel beta-helix repeat-containing protein [Geopsychrobacter electrodiphilus]|uniref:right-handed parallel beta-helix repeat-containing protein n=1 Tax=Geopsychrobacter electrodiphilus TaxID=225196 RepID=UPI0003AA43D4|nr:right-handed parallel beta-helix repeat-containing protein [Geopsychrobacter electrodiphilus]
MKIFLLLVLLALPSLATALEYHGENTLYVDTQWQGEVLIDGILTVATGATLEIRPGTHVRFVRRDTNGDGIGESELFAQGRFIARGTAAEPVVFTSAESNPAPGDWGALNMMMNEEGENLLEHCLVEYAYRGFHAHFSNAHLRASTFRHNQRGAQFQESTVTIEDCTFRDNFNGLQFRDSKVSLKNSSVVSNHWGVRAVFVTLLMSHCQIEGNLTNGVSLRDSSLTLSNNQITNNRRGIYLQRSSGTLRGNRIEDNREHGIYLEDSIADVQFNLISGNGRSGLKVLDSGGSVENNRIENNGEFAFFNAGTDDFSVGANWYGLRNATPSLVDGLSRPGAGRLLLAPSLSQQPEAGTF